MEFGLLPPDINSGRMYVGPGSGPMLAAAAAWDGLAAELHSAANLYGSVTSELSAGPWLGAASAAMTAAAAPYVAWMRATAAQAEQTAVQAKAAAAAYEVTFAAMVPPTEIAANRALLQALVATNLFGQNAPAIAATESLYAEMWAQDAAAMYGYAGASASARTLTPFSPAPQTTTGSSALPGLTSAATTSAASVSVGDELSSVETNVLFLPGLAQAGLTPLDTISEFVDLSADDSELDIDGALQGTEDKILAVFKYNGYRLPPEVEPMPASTPSVSAGLGQAASVGRLSVPSGWTVAAPEMRLAAVTLPSTSVAAAPEVMAASRGSLFSDMIAANMIGRAMSGTPTPGRQERIACAQRASKTDTSPTGHMTAIAADVQEFAQALVKLGDLRDCGLLTDEEFSKEKERLLAR